MFTKTLIATTVAAILMPSLAKAEVAYTDFGQRYVQPVSSNNSSCGANVRVYVIGNNNQVDVKVACKNTAFYPTHSYLKSNPKQIGYKATLDFYRQHSIDNGESTSNFTSLYAYSVLTPDGIIDRNVLVSKIEDYNQKYNVLKFFVDEDNLDFADCVSLDNCIVRGTIITVWKTNTTQVIKHSSADFVLNFDLTKGNRVKAECSVTESARNHAKGCDDFLN